MTYLCLQYTILTFLHYVLKKKKNAINILSPNESFILDNAWKVSLFGVFLVCIFPNLDWIRRDTEYFPSIRRSIFWMLENTDCRKALNTGTFRAYFHLIVWNTLFYKTTSARSIIVSVVIFLSFQKSYLFLRAEMPSSCGMFGYTPITKWF